MKRKDFQKLILEGIPNELPILKKLDHEINHAPKRKNILTKEEKKLAIENALRYFPEKFHIQLAKEFLYELNTYGRIYMYRFKPNYKIFARNIYDYPHKSLQAAAIMLMINNNLDEAVAQHPDELITYGGNGSVFQNWAQYRLTMKYLATMTDEQTLVLYSGHPLGLFPSHKNAPRLVLTNGLMIPNYSTYDDWEKYNALGVTQYGQMTAGSFMYIGPQGIVHGTTITLLNAARNVIKIKKNVKIKNLLFVSSGLGGMSGAQPKAAKISELTSIIAEINEKAAQKRLNQGWVDEIVTDLNTVIEKALYSKKNGECKSFAYLGNIVDLWEKLAELKIPVEIGSDQTSLHNPYAGGYYPVDLTFEESNRLMSENPEKFKQKVHQSLRRHVDAINKLTKQGMYFFDYGNAFLLESSRAKANVLDKNNQFIYPSYIQDILGPLCFDYGFGPFRWVCTSGDKNDLDVTDKIAENVLNKLIKKAPKEIYTQLSDNIHWIKQAKKNKMVVGSQARILYADSEGRIEIAKAFNKAIAKGIISAPIVLGRDHHDVSGTDSPYRETSNIYDGSKYTADMAVQNFVGDSFRGATWVSLHNGGGVGWGEVINGGFGLVIDGTKQAEKNIESMLFWDVNNGISRRNWARNTNAIFTIKREMKRNSNLIVTLPTLVKKEILDSI